MATEAQIRANRANAQKSRGPTTEEGKARSRLNALKHGLRVEVAGPLVAPQEDPAELAARIQAWIDEYQPMGVVERDLIERAARLSWTLDRAERHEAAILARRVRAAMIDNQAERAAEVAGLARKLLYMCGKRATPGSGPAWDDDPAVFAAALERSPEGTRWLIERWTEIRLLIDSGAAWTFADQFRFIRLLGKRPIDAVDDPELNAIVLAWEAIEENWGVAFWNKMRDATPSDDPAFSAWRVWRALAAPAESPEAGWSLLRAIVDRELERLNERLEILEEVDGADALELAERALFCASDGAERLRRFQTARARELLRTLDAIAKLRKAAAGLEPSKKAPSEANPPVDEPSSVAGLGAKASAGYKNRSSVAGLCEAGTGVGSAKPASRGHRPRLQQETSASQDSSVAGLCEAETGVGAPRPASRGHRSRLQQETSAGRARLL